MLPLQYDCPHCLTRRCHFKCQLVIPHKDTQTPFFAHCIYQCASCAKSILVSIEADDTNRLDSRFGGNQRLDGAVGVKILETWPAFPKPEIPEHLPTRVAELFLEAEQNIADKRLDSASANLRKCLELALSDLTPDVEAFRLHGRIKKLHELGVITDSLKDWADNVKELGNDGVHSFDKPLEDDLQQMCLLTKYLLIYLFTLPRKVELAKHGDEQIP